LIERPRTGEAHAACPRHPAASGEAVHDPGLPLRPDNRFPATFPLPAMTDDRVLLEAAQTAARLIVEDGLDYASARRKAMQEHGLRNGPGNEMIEDEVRAHIEIFHADTQPAELRVLRAAALRWMLRLAEFRPHLSGAVWRGTATRQSVIRLDLYCDDTKSPELALLNRGIDYETVSEPIGRGGHALTLIVGERSPELDDWLTIHLNILDLDDLRGALKPDARGKTWRGDAAALQRLLESE
jgi:hypothetical protein